MIGKMADLFKNTKVGFFGRNAKVGTVANLVGGTVFGATKRYKATGGSAHAAWGKRLAIGTAGLMGTAGAGMALKMNSDYKNGANKAKLRKQRLGMHPQGPRF